jgi:hypothetical protein
MPIGQSPGGGGGSGGGAYTLLSTNTLSVDGVFDITGISQSYNDLYMILIVRATRPAATAEFLQCRLNNDATASAYDGAFVDNAVAGTSLNATSGRISGAIPAASSAAGFFATCEISLPGYTSTLWNKAVYALNSCPSVSGTTLVTETAAMVWKNTAAVNRVGFFGGNTANLLTGSVLRVYGRL